MCSGQEHMPVPMAGYWTSYTSIDLAHTVYPCTKGTCTGGDAADRSCWTASNYSLCDADIQCSPGATGILCGVCLDEFTFNNIRNQCISCASAQHGERVAVARIHSRMTAVCSNIASLRRVLITNHPFHLSLSPNGSRRHRWQPRYLVVFGYLAI